MPRKEDDLDMLAELLATEGLDIKAQEQRGQRRLVNSDVLPRKCNDTFRGQLEQMSIVFGEDFDDLFVNVELPEGWSKISTDHAMWSKLVDDRGRERASIFYKAAFYDRDAHINITRRFSARWSPWGDTREKATKSLMPGVVWSKIVGKLFGKQMKLLMLNLKRGNNILCGMIADKN